MCKIMLAPPSTRKDEFTLGQKMLAGCISGGVGSVIATPTDLVKVRNNGEREKDKLDTWKREDSSILRNK